MTLTVVMGFVAGSVWTGGDRTPWKAGVVVGVSTFSPILAIVGASFWWARRIFRGISSKRSEGAQSVAELRVLARVLLMGISSGLSLHGALTHAHAEVSGSVGGHVSAVLKQFRTLGLASALASVPGPASGLFSQLAGASVSGGPAAPVIAAFLREHEASAKARRLAQMRKLPIKLTIPLTLLILPGCVLLFVGPSFVRGIADLLPTFGAL